MLRTDYYFEPIHARSLAPLVKTRGFGMTPQSKKERVTTDYRTPLG